jgi:glycosyltransferase involved in cell wall biosynthesis
MKVLLVANTDWYLYNHRLALAQFLRRQGFEVVLVSPPGSYTSQLAQAGFRWVEWPVGRASTLPWQEARAVLRLASIYKEERPHLVHHFTIKPILYGTFAARLAGVRSTVNSVTGRGYIFLSAETKARLLRPAVKLLYRFTLRSTHSQIIFENGFDQQYFIENHLSAAGRTHLIPGVGVDPQKFIPLPEAEGLPVITYAGRLLWDKGVGILIEAGRRLRDRGLSFRLALVGEPDAGNPSSIGAATIQQWVTQGDAEWWGFQAEMVRVYQQTHIVTLPSFGEGVPTTLIEAAAMGRPLVATDIAGCREVIRDGENGFLVPMHDPVALAGALEKLLIDPGLRQRMGAAGRQIVLEKFTHEIINRQTAEVYRSFFPGLELD